MREIVLSVMGLLVLAAAPLRAAERKPNLSGKWKLDASRTESGPNDKALSLLIEDGDRDIHVKETRGPDSREDISEFTCGKMGKECPMQDGREKAYVSVYYNGAVLVVLKTHGRKGCSVEKRRFSLTPAGDSLLIEVLRIEPAGKPEQLAFSKVP
jgi:hypothetical protein